MRVALAGLAGGGDADSGLGVAAARGVVRDDFVMDFPAAAFFAAVCLDSVVVLLDLAAVFFDVVLLALVLVLAPFFDEVPAAVTFFEVVLLALLEVAPLHPGAARIREAIAELRKE